VDTNKILSLIQFKLRYNKSYFIVKKLINIKYENIIIYPGAIIINTGLIEDINQIMLSVIYNVKPIGIAHPKNIQEGIIIVTPQELMSLLISKKLVPYYTDTNKEDRELLDAIKEI